MGTYLLNLDTVSLFELVALCSYKFLGCDGGSGGAEGGRAWWRWCYCWHCSWCWRWYVLLLLVRPLFIQRPLPALCPQHHPDVCDLHAVRLDDGLLGGRRLVQPLAGLFHGTPRGCTERCVRSPRTVHNLPSPGRTFHLAV